MPKKPKVQTHTNKDIPLNIKQQDIAPTIKKKNQKVSLKNVLCTPFNIQWPKIESDVEFSILDELQKVLSKYNLHKSKKCKSSKKDGKLLIPEFQIKTEDERNLRSQLVCGINEVTKHLERDNLRLILVDKAAYILTRHLIQLAGVRCCSAVALGTLTKKAAPLLSMTQLSCIGFHKVKEGDNLSFNDLVNLVQNKCTKIELPWLSFEESFKKECKSSSVKEQHIQPNVQLEKNSLLISKSGKIDCDHTNNDYQSANSKDKSLVRSTLDFIPFGNNDSIKCEHNKPSTIHSSKEFPNSTQRKRKFSTKDQLEKKFKEQEEGNKCSNYQTLSLHKMQGNMNKVKRKKKKKQK